MMLRSLACLIFVLLSSTALQAQFSSTLKSLKRNHIVGEPVMVRLTLTNYTGQEQILQGNRMPWISFMVKTRNGNPIIARRVAGPKPVRIGPGQTMARDFNLSQMFQLNEVGNYTVSAVIRPQNSNLEGTTTNRTHFEMSEGRAYWSQKVGSVGPAKATHEYRVLQFRSDKSTQLFVQIRDDGTGQIIRTIPLGDSLTIRNPSITVDGDRHLNVLFITNPTTYFHYRISPKGVVVTRDMHRRAATGDPKLTLMNQGIVVVTNSIFHDPEQAAIERAKIRKITDRPGRKD